MEAKKVAKLKAVRGGWNPSADDPPLRALAKELAAEFTATTPLDTPPGEFHRALAEFWAEFERGLKELRRAADAADAATEASPIRRAEKKGRIRSERAGKLRLAGKPSSNRKTRGFNAPRRG